jgi:hypothetical protein
MGLARKEMTLENLLPIIRAALALVATAVALALVLGHRRRHGKPTANLGPVSPTASAAHSRPETASRTS